MAFIFPVVLAALAALTLLVPAPEDGQASALDPDPRPVVDRLDAQPDIAPDVRDDPAPRGDAGMVNDDESELAPRVQDDLVPDVETEAADLQEDAALAVQAPRVLMPVEGVRVAEVPPTFGDPRGSGRAHAGVDIMAPRGTPVRAAAPGTVWRIGESGLGGLSVTIIDDAGIRYFYTHLDGFAEGLETRQRVDVDTVIGYVGNTGNASATAPHLHFEVSLPVEGQSYRWTHVDPLPLLQDREP